MAPDPAGQYQSPYLGMGNRPIKRWDPDGRDDYVYDRKTGEWKLVVKDLTRKCDRLLKTNWKGEIKEYKNGDYKVDIDKISKGIVYDGLNFRNRDIDFFVGGKGEPTVMEFNNFLYDFSKFLGKEISWFGYGLETDIINGLKLPKKVENLEFFHVFKYEDNKKKTAKESLIGSMYTLNFVNYKVMHHGHTHPGLDGKISERDKNHTKTFPLALHYVLYKNRGYKIYDKYSD